MAWLGLRRIGKGPWPLCGDGEAALQLGATDVDFDVHDENPWRMKKTASISSPHGSTMGNGFG